MDLACSSAVTWRDVIRDRKRPRAQGQHGATGGLSTLLQTPDPAEAGPRGWKETEAWRTEAESCGLGFSPRHLEPQFPFLGL